MAAALLPLPPPSIVVWRDYSTDPPNVNGYFYIILRLSTRGVREADEALYPWEAQRWSDVPYKLGEWTISDGTMQIPESDILWWAFMPAVPNTL